jgi:acetolactate synthase-1/3 small subunit
MKHTLSVLVENKPGVLMRITSMFARRGFNIDSLAVGPTERHDVSRITIRVDCETSPLEQIEKQMPLGEVFHARVVDLGSDSIVFELTGSPEEVDSFEELVRPHGVQELVRTGRIGLSRAHRPHRDRPRQHVLA